MRRIIFCPNESNISEAEDIAKKTNLPINIGIFEQIEELDFDKKKTQVLEIPEIRYVSYKQQCANYFHQTISYYNDFSLLKNRVSLIIDNINYQPVLAENHKVRFLILENTLGNKKCNIVDINNKILESFNYDVC
jgi:hypothetical protein